MWGWNDITKTGDIDISKTEVIDISKTEDIDISKTEDIDNTKTEDIDNTKTEDKDEDIMIWDDGHVSELCEKRVCYDGNYAYTRFEELRTRSGEVLFTR